jgi:hypothetical protein
LLYANIQISEVEIKTTIPFPIPLKKRNQVSRNKFNQIDKELYNKNSKTLMKEIEEDIKNGKYILGSWIRKISIIKMSMLLQVIQ